MNSPEHIHDARSRDERLNEMAQRPLTSWWKSRQRIWSCRQAAQTELP